MYAWPYPRERGTDAQKPAGRYASEADRRKENEGNEDAGSAADQGLPLVHSSAQHKPF